MKFRILTSITAITFVAALAIRVPLAAQEHTRYKLVELGTFGGPNSYFAFMDGKSVNSHG
jgi:hypothetical protein